MNGDILVPESKRVTLATGLDYRYLEWDHGGEHTVVLVHGFLDFADGWRRTVSAGLAGHYHVVAPDMRGHGDSDRVGTGGYYHFLDYVADLESLIETAGRRHVSIVGHSMGGMVASYYTSAYPKHVRALALLEGLGPPEMKAPMPARIAAWIRGWRNAAGKKARIYESIDAAAARLREYDSRLDTEQAIELARYGTRPAESGVAFKHDVLHLTRGPYPFRVDLARDCWRAIECPVLYVEGDNTQLVYEPHDRDTRLASFKNIRTEVLGGAGHMMQRHRPHELAILLHEFLSASAPIEPSPNQS